MQRVRALPRLLAIPAALQKGHRVDRRAEEGARAGSSRRDAAAQITGSAEHGVTGVEVAAGERHEARSRMRCRRARLSPASRDAARRSRRLRIPLRRRRAAMAPAYRRRRPQHASRASIWRATARACAAPMPPSARAGSRRWLHCTTRGMQGAKASDACAPNSRASRASPPACAQRFRGPRNSPARLPDETIVCRCEAITAGELRRVVRETGAQEANRAKAFSRVGMGRCQGRFCAHAGAEVIAAEARVPLASVGRLARTGARQAVADGACTKSIEKNRRARNERASRCDRDRRRHHGHVDGVLPAPAQRAR